MSSNSTSTVDDNVRECLNELKLDATSMYGGKLTKGQMIKTMHVSVYSYTAEYIRELCGIRNGLDISILGMEEVDSPLRVHVHCVAHVYCKETTTGYAL